MKSFFEDIFAYHHHFNQKLGKQIESHKERVSERVHFLFSHLVLAHQIWNSRILGLEALNLNQTLSLEKCLDLDTVNLQRTLQILSEYDLSQSVIYHNTRGNEFTNSIQDILYHVTNHSSHHKGQIVAALRQGGIEPIVTDYIFYKRG